MDNISWRFDNFVDNVVIGEILPSLPTPQARATMWADCQASKAYIANGGDIAEARRRLLQNSWCFPTLLRGMAFYLLLGLMFVDEFGLDVCGLDPVYK